MNILQHQLVLPAHARGFHLITGLVQAAFTEHTPITTGLLHVFIQHTSAGLTLNENADPTVRADFESHFNKMVPEQMPYYKHTLEGPDDMPAHIKASLLGNQVTVPVTHGTFNLGTWQGIYLCEHRDYGGRRKLLLTAMGV